MPIAVFSSRVRTVVGRASNEGTTLKDVLVLIAFMGLVLCSCSQAERGNLPQSAAELSSSLSDPLQFGERLFVSYQCRSCHQFRGVGGTIGPGLDELSSKMDGTAIREAILEPDRRISPGFQPGVMPKDYGTRFNERELDALIYYLSGR